jgi:hypothetical protein
MYLWIPKSIKLGIWLKQLLSQLRQLFFGLQNNGISSSLYFLYLQWEIYIHDIQIWWNCDKAFDSSKELTKLGDIHFAGLAANF